METRDYDATNVKPTGGFDPVPMGEYTLAISNVTEKSTRNGDPGYSIELEVTEPAQWAGRKVWHFVTLLPFDVDGTGTPAKGAGMAIHFLKSIGEPYQGKIKVNPNNWFDRTLKAKIGIAADSMGRDKNIIVSLFADPNAVIPGGVKTDDALPF
jgi:hypothetical protein